MNKETEDLLMEYKTNTYDDISIPENIGAFIEKGIQQKNAYQKTQWRKRIPIIAACFAMMVFLTAIRISPAFASYVSQIPGLDYIVKLVNYDKGLQKAIENDFIQSMDISDTHEDITFTVDSITMDESRMVIFFTIENKGDHNYLQLRDVQLKNEKGEILSMFSSHPCFGEINFNEERKNSGQIEVSFQPEDELPDTITLEANINEAKQSWIVYSEEQASQGNHDITDGERFIKLESSWSIDIPIDKEKYNNHKKVYYIDKTISVYNQNIDIKQFTIYPTRMQLDVVYDENNPLKIFSFENLRITDKKEEWGTIINGVTSSHIDEIMSRYYFQSNYFTYSKELYLEGDGIYALEKEHLDVIVDLKNEKLLKAPDDQMRLQSVESNGDHYVLHFNIPKYSENMLRDIFDRTFKDAKGQEFESNRTGMSSNWGEDVGYYDLHYYIPKNVDMDNIITLKIIHYPNLIYASFKVRIK